MPLVTAPFFTLNSVYRPNVFLVSMPSPDPLVLAQASIVIDLVGVTSISKTPSFKIGTTYYFEFDVSKMLQTQSAPKSTAKTTVFPDLLNQAYNVTNTDCHTTVGLIISYYYNDSTTGLLTQFGTTDIIGSGYPAIIGTRQTRDWQTMGMDLYVLAFGGGSPFLTNAPSVYNICQNENAFLTFVSTVANAVKVTTYDSSLTQIDSGLFSITPSPTYVPTTIGTGLANLLTQSYFSGAVNASNPNIYQYTVQVGQAFLVGSSWLFFPFSEERRYQLTTCCNSRTLRLHWLNRLGGADAYTFTAKRSISEKSKSELAQKPQSWGLSYPPTSSFDRGLFKIQTEVVTEYEALSTFYGVKEGRWIAELLSSPEVYLETDSGLVSVIIEDSNITIEETDELVNVAITFVESNYISVQQN